MPGSCEKILSYSFGGAAVIVPIGGVALGVVDADIERAYALVIGEARSAAPQEIVLHPVLNAVDGHTAAGGAEYISLVGRSADAEEEQEPYRLRRFGHGHVHVGNTGAGDIARTAGAVVIVKGVSSYLL